MAFTSETGFNTTLAQKLDAGTADTEIALAALPITITSGVMLIGSGNSKEWVYFGTVDAGSVEIRTCQRGLDKDATSTSDTSTANIKSHRVGDPVRLVQHSLMQNSKPDQDATETISGAWDFTGANTATSTTKMVWRGQNVTTAQRDALTNVADGGWIYNTTDGKFQDRTAGSWVDRESGGTFANASTTVAGKVEKATSAEFIAETDTGGTGASLFASPVDLKMDLPFTTDYTFGATITQGEVVYNDSADAKWKLADANAAGAYDNMIGIALDDGVDTDTGKRVALPGAVITGLSGLTAGVQYLSDTAGAITNSAGTNQLVLGFAPNATTLWFYPSVATTTQERSLVDGSDVGSLHAHTAAENIKIGSDSFGPTGVSDTKTIAHGLGRTPKIVRIYWGTSTAVNFFNGLANGYVLYDGSTTSAISRKTTVAGSAAWSSGFNVNDDNDGTVDWTGAVAVDGTNITISVGTFNTTCPIVFTWEVQ